MARNAVARPVTPAPVAGAARVTGTRNAALDLLRAIAVVAMIAYHFCFDLRYFGVTRSDFEHDLFWLSARSLILGTFLYAAGVSLVLALRTDPQLRKFWRHAARIALAAIAVSAASYAMFPRTYIWFGVLHAIVASLVLARPFVGHQRLALATAVAVLVAGLTLGHPVFDNRALGWLGFMTHKPSTEDYVPLFPWFGVVLAGVATADGFVRATAALNAHRFARGVLWPGRHSLLIYLVHQPVMIGALWLALR